MIKSIVKVYFTLVMPKCILNIPRFFQEREANVRMIC